MLAVLLAFLTLANAMAAAVPGGGSHRPAQAGAGDAPRPAAVPQEQQGTQDLQRAGVAGWSDAARAAWLQALSRGEGVEVTVAPLAGQSLEVRRQIVAGGGRILWEGRATSIIGAWVPAPVLPRLLPLLDAVQVDGPVVAAVPSSPSPAPEASDTPLPFERALHQANQEAMGAAALRAAHGVTGAGIRVAVIDTGVDPGLPALQRRIVDYVDFTAPVPFAQRAERARAAGQGVLQQGQNPGWAAEGDVFLTGTARAGRAGEGGTPLRWDNLEVLLPAWAAGREVRLGWLDEANVGPGGTDLNGNGTVRDRWLVVAYPEEGAPGGPAQASPGGAVEAREPARGAQDPTAESRGAGGGAQGPDGEAKGAPEGATGAAAAAAAGAAARPPGGPAVQVDADQDLDLAEEQVLWPISQGGGVTWLEPAQTSGRAGPGGQPGAPGAPGATAVATRGGTAGEPAPARVASSARGPQGAQGPPPPATGPVAPGAAAGAGTGPGPVAPAGAGPVPSAPGVPPSGMALVVTDLDPQGVLVNFGFDAHGHGTRMASILAAAGTAYQGVAPGVQLMVLKALGSRGQGDWSQILAAVDYAVEHGVDIISLSAESQSPGDELAVTERALRQAMARGVLPVLAAGNGGPGLHTALALPADAGLVVGAFLPAEAAALLGDPSGERLLPYSAAGPARDGTPSPSLVAPGVTYTLVPSWQARLWPGGLAPDEGTSVAVPYVAGLAALLLDQARRDAPDLPAASLAPLLQATARPLAGVPATVQGFGVPVATAAAERLGAMPSRHAGDGAAGSSGWSVLWLHRGRPYRGVVWDGPAPGVLTLAVRHGGPQPVVARWTAVPAWAVFPGPIPYPGGEGVYLPVQYDLPQRPGLYSALVRLEGGAPLPAGFLQTFVRPHALDGGNLQVRGSVGRGQVQRMFVDVPPGVTRLVFRVDRQDTKGADEGGSLSAWVFAPGGRLVRDSARDTGQLIGGPEAPDWTVEVPSPEPGVWEVDLFFSPLSPVAFDRAASTFRVTVTAQGVAWQPRELDVEAPGTQGGRLWEGVTLVPYGRAVRGRVAGMGWDAGLAVTVRAARAEGSTSGPGTGDDGSPAGAPGGAPAAAGPGGPAGPPNPGGGSGTDPMTEERAEVTVLAGEPQPYRFDVPAGTALLEVKAGPAPRAGWRPHLYLYRVEGGAAQPVGDGEGDPVAVVADPVPGRYYAVIELEPAGVESPSWDDDLGNDPGPQAIPLVVRQFRSGGGIRVAAGSVELAAGQPARIMAVLDVPPGTGEQRGYLVLLDEAGAVSAPLPVRIRRGPPRLVVTAVIPPVAQGEAARITLQVRDRTDGLLRDASLIVGGRFHTTAGGQVTLPWDGRSETLVVRVLGAGEESVQSIRLPGAP